MITKAYYDRLLALLREKGVDTSGLPQLDEVEIEDVNLGNERDVELHLLEPLLAEIGFQPSDWIRQMKLRVGRSEKAIPDYVSCPLSAVRIMHREPPGFGRRNLAFDHINNCGRILSKRRPTPDWSVRLA